MSDRFLEAVEAVSTQLGVAVLKEKQRELIIAFISCRDTFVVLPTGYGKSLRAEDELLFV
jgi:superfamily II DNA helicase RecQ